MLSKHERYHGLGKDALVIVFSRNTNAIHGLGMDALVIVFSRNTNAIYGLGMDALVIVFSALVIVCSRNTSLNMVWAWML